MAGAGSTSAALRTSIRQYRLWPLGACAWRYGRGRSRHRARRCGFPELRGRRRCIRDACACEVSAASVRIAALIAGKGGWTPGNHAAVANVARMMGISPHADANLGNPAMMRKFRNALMVQELGPGGARHAISKLAGRARGGPVNAGQSYVVGEQGWEIFKPRQSGEIVNQKQLAAEGRNAAHGGQTIHFAPTIHVNGAQDAQLVANQVERHIRNKLGQSSAALIPTSASRQFDEVGNAPFADNCRRWRAYQ